MTRAMYDLAKIEYRRRGSGWQLQCIECGAWRKQLYAARVDERDSPSWLCLQCVAAFSRRLEKAGLIGDDS